jgi:hypothetical protein
MTSTMLETLMVRCFAGVLEAASHCKHSSWQSLQSRSGTYLGVISLASPAAWAAPLPSSSVTGTRRVQGGITGNR